MPAQKIQLHFVVTPAGEVEMYGTQFLGQTNTKPARLKYWKTNTCLEVREPAKIVSWSFTSLSGQFAELAHHLGPGFTVLRQHEALKAIEQAQSPTFIVSEQTFFIGQPDGAEIRYAGQDRTTAKKIYDALKTAGVQVFAETKLGALTLDNDF